MSDLKQLPILTYQPPDWPAIDVFWSQLHGKQWDDRARRRWHWLNARRTHFIVKANDRILGNATLLRQPFVTAAAESFELGWITEFYVSPELKGQGMGKRLTTRLEESTAAAATLGQSEDARQCFARLQWTAPAWLPLLAVMFPGLRSAPRSALRMEQATFRHADIDDIWHRRGPRAVALGARNAATLAQRFEGRPDAAYEIWLARNENDPVGYIVLRLIRGQRNRMFGWLPVGLIVDVLAVADDPAALARMVRFGATRLGRKGALFALAVETVGATGRALRASGFAPALQLGGLTLKTLPAKGLMLNAPGTARCGTCPHVTFLDCDAELTF